MLNPEHSSCGLLELMTKTTQYEICPICDHGNMVAFDDGTYKFRYKRKVHKVLGTHYAKCESCGATGYLHGQLEYNKNLIEEYQSKIVSIISPSKILDLREKYNLTQEKASKIFGGGINAFSKWERGEVVPSEPTAKLMLLALENEQTLLRLAEISQVRLTHEVRKAKHPLRRKTDFKTIQIVDDSIEVYRVVKNTSQINQKPSTKIHYEDLELDAKLIPTEYDDVLSEQKKLWPTSNQTDHYTLN